jgi:hypothetical protein
VFFCLRLFFSQEGGEGAVVVFIRQDELLFDECEIRMGVEEFLYLQVVLLRLDGACAVYEAAIRFDGQRGLMEDFRLDDGEFRKLLEVERPFGVRFAAENACVGAGNVQKDGIQATVTLTRDGERYTIKSGGDGRLDAVSNAVKKFLGATFTITTYTEHALTVSSKSDAVSYVGIEVDGKTYWGVGIRKDITDSSVAALFSALDRWMEATK